MKTSCCHSASVSNLNGTLICLNEHCDNYLSATRPCRRIWFTKSTAILSAFFFLLFFSFDNFSMKRVHPGVVQVLPPQARPVIFSMDALKQELEKNDILCAGAVLAQMKLESAHFKSFLFRHANNMMGMRYPFTRRTAASGIYIPARDTVILGTQESLRPYRRIANTYAVYATWQDAVRDYKLWQEHSFNLDERYLDFLGKVYAQDQRYIHKIRQVASTL